MESACGRARQENSYITLLRMTWQFLFNKMKNMKTIYFHKISFLFLVQQGKFTARVIQRELAMITNLMTPNNFENVTKDDGSPFNVSNARVWFEVGRMLEVVICPVSWLGIPRHPLLSHLQHDLQSGGLRYQRSLQTRKGLSCGPVCGVWLKVMSLSL